MRVDSNSSYSQIPHRQKTMHQMNRIAPLLLSAIIGHQPASTPLAAFFAEIKFAHGSSFRPQSRNRAGRTLNADAPAGAESTASDRKSHEDHDPHPEHRVKRKRVVSFLEDREPAAGAGVQRVSRALPLIPAEDEEEAVNAITLLQITERGRRLLREMGRKTLCEQVAERMWKVVEQDHCALPEEPKTLPPPPSPSLAAGDSTLLGA